MSLLPKTKQDFTQKEYWNSFFEKRGKQTFEWYGEYPQLCEHVHKYIKTRDTILNVGCGNSKLGEDLYDFGCKSIVNIDTSQLVINQMTKQNQVKRPDLKFIKADAREMTSFADGEFTVVFDKGTLDAIFVDETESVVEDTRRYWNEIDRVLRIGGRYVCVSLLQKHIIEAMVKRFAENNWMFRVVRCHDAEKSSDNDGSPLPVFMVIATKLQKLPIAVLETCMAGEKMIRVNTGNELVEAVLLAQKTALVINGLQRTNLDKSNEVSIELYDPNIEETPRFSVYVVDHHPKERKGRYAAFIVPFGQERQWGFTTPKGRQQLAEDVAYNRLAIFVPHRGHKYGTKEDIQTEVGAMILKLRPSNVRDNQIPCMSTGDDQMQREMICKGKSNLSGEYIVEDVFLEADQSYHRILKFLDNEFVIQSEALLKIVEDDDGVTKTIVPAFLACDHHLLMSIGVNIPDFVGPPRAKEKHIVVIGLGGGGLCKFLHAMLPDIYITAVDNDPAMLTVATNYFDLTPDERLKVIIDDGIKFLKRAAQMGESYDAILFDVDSKDPTIGMSCPPTEFVAVDVLSAVKTLLKPYGIFILNLVCRNQKIKVETLKTLKKMFNSMETNRLPDDLNEVVFCLNIDADNPQYVEQWMTCTPKAAKIVKDWLIKEECAMDMSWWDIFHHRSGKLIRRIKKSEERSKKTGRKSEKN